MGPPAYRSIESDAIPEFSVDGVTARVVAGHSHGVAGALRREHTEPLYLDLHLDAGAAFAQSIPEGHNAFIYVYRGTAAVGATTLPRQHMAVLANTAGSDGVQLSASDDGPARLLLIAGRPLNEPIAQYGPFVMNTHAEIFQAVEDFQAGRLG
jgi:redox-sensitive bicupin YhaK (pirin superfamily)